MGIKIHRSVLVDNYQRIHILGCLSPIRFRRYFSKFNDPAFSFNYNYTREQISHFAIKNFIDSEECDLALWLMNNKAKTTGYIDKTVFNYHPSSEYSIFEYGIGFKPDDPLEDWFILRWS